MKKKLLIALGVVAGLILIFTIVVALQPAHYRVERTGHFAAPPAVVFAKVNDLHQWEAWSPWAKLDPASKNTFSGAPAGTGAVFAWSGNSDIGEGDMTITDSKPNEDIQIRLHFVQPMEDTCVSAFAFKPDGNGTAVTWSMEGEKGFVSKAVCMFMNMDKMLGGEFEKGLASLKRVVEAPAPAATVVPAAAPVAAPAAAHP